MGPFFDSRKFLRTPGFIQDGVYDDRPEPLPDASQYDEGPPMAAQPLPPRQQYQAEAPRREYDDPRGISGMLEGAREVEPPQTLPPRRQIDIPAAPLPPKIGMARKILGTAVGMYLPEVGHDIRNPGYDRAMQEYGNQVNQLKLRSELEHRGAQTEEQIARARAEGNRGSAEQARGRNFDARTADIGKAPVLVNKNQRMADRFGKVLLEAEEGEEKVPTTLEGAAARALTIKDPAEREDMLKRITDAHNLLHPEKPITQIKVGGNGEIVAVTVDPKKVQAAGGSMTVGRVAPKPTKPSATDERRAEEASGDEVIIADLASADPRTDWNNLGVKEQNRLRPKLIAKGWTEPVKLGVDQKKTIQTMDVVIPKIKSILEEYKNSGAIAGTGRVIGRLPSAVVSSKGEQNRIKMGDIFSLVANLRSGGAIPEPEMERLDAFLASQDKSDSFNVNALEDLLGSFERSKANMLRRPTSGGGGGATQPPPATTSGQPTIMIKNGIKRAVSPDKVAAAKAAGYKEVR